MNELLSLQESLAGRFAVERLLGRGGMGAVYLARDLTLDRPVAVKLLAPALAGLAPFRERFLREARAAARLSHPHIVPIHAVEDHGAVVCIIMGFVAGETLGQRVERAGHLPVHEAVRLLREVTWALGHAHAVGIVHRDIKPDNILLEAHTGRALVTDFGIAQVHDDPGGSGERAGTPDFMSPEQATGAPVDGRSDLYSLGVTLFFAAAGRVPRRGETLLSIRPDFPLALAEAIDHCRALDRDQRPASAEALTDLVDAAPAGGDDVPLPVASYVREAQQVGADMAAAGVAAATALGVYAIGFRNDLYGAIAFYPIAALLLGLGATRFGELVLRTRALLAQGFTHQSLTPAIRIEREHQEVEARIAEALPRVLTERTGVMLALGAAKTALFVWLATRQIDILTLIGVAGAVLIPTATIRKLWRTTPRAKDLWARLLEGRVGRTIFRIARIANPAAARPGLNAPTAVLLGDGARRLFDQLPAGVQQRFPELPGIVNQLEARAGRTDGQTDRRTEALAALEALRLDLLRLQAGQVEANALTQDLDNARALAQRVDDELNRS